MATLAGLVAAVVAAMASVAAMLVLLSLIGLDPRKPPPPGFGWIVYAIVGATIAVAVIVFRDVKHRMRRPKIPRN